MKTLRKLIHILDYQHWLYFNPKQTTSKWVTKRLLVCLIAKVPKSYSEGFTSNRGLHPWESIVSAWCSVLHEEGIERMDERLAVIFEQMVVWVFLLPTSGKITDFDIGFFGGAQKTSLAR